MFLRLYSAMYIDCRLLRFRLRKRLNANNFLTLGLETEGEGLTGAFATVAGNDAAVVTIIVVICIISYVFINLILR